MLTIADLAEKKKDLTQQREQAVANVHAIDGALLLLEQLIGLSKEAEAKPSQSPDA